ENGKHRKWVACLSDKVFRRFLDNTLYPYYVENTIGMLGGMTPEGMDIGLMPAWSLRPDYIDPDVILQDAYVCPINETEEECEFLKSMNYDELGEWIKEEYIR
ncbi:MAG: hypothetical protein ACP5D6_06335, partial [Kosmotogaceae bacterium]